MGGGVVSSERSLGVYLVLKTLAAGKEGNEFDGGWGDTKGESIAAFRDSVKREKPGSGWHGRSSRGWQSLGGSRQRSGTHSSKGSYAGGSHGLRSYLEDEQGEGPDKATRINSGPGRLDLFVLSQS